MILVILTTVIIAIVLYLSLIGKIYPVLIYLMSILLLYQTTLIGLGVVGSDIQLELYYAREALAHGWNHGLVESQSNLSVVIGVLAPFLSKIFDIDLLIIFKWIFPAMFAFVPVILFCAFKKQFGEKTALYAVLFFVIIPVFNMEIASIAKSMVAELFLAVAIWIVASDIKSVYKCLGLVACAALAFVTHYTIGSILICYLIGIVLFVFAGKIVRLKVFQGPFPYYFLVVIAIIAFAGFSYFSIVGSGMLIRTYSIIANWLAGNVSSLFTHGNLVVPVGYNTIVEVPITIGYLQQQPAFVRAGTGFDFLEVSLLGKIFRIVQYFTELMIIIGAGYCLFCKKAVKPEFMAGILTALTMLAFCIFIPVFSMIVNMTRFYHMALFFLAPCFVIGFEIFKKAKPWVLTLVFIVYYVFASGIAFEVANVTDITRIDVPFSHALSAERTGSAGVYTQGDLDCARWMVEEGDPQLRTCGDQNSMALISSYTYYYPRIADDPSKVPLSWNRYYLLLSDWNYRHNQYTKVSTFGTGLRVLEAIPSLEHATEVYSSGTSKVYLVDNEAD